MSGAGSSSNYSGSSGSNAVSHVYIQHPPLRCHIPGSRKLFYDDANKLILSLTSDQILSWKTAPYDPSVIPSSVTIQEGPVLSVRFSLDLKLLAIQRSSTEIQIWNKETGDTFSQKCRSESESILGFFWTDCPTYDIIFVKTRSVLRDRILSNPLLGALPAIFDLTFLNLTIIRLFIESTSGLDFYSYNPESKSLRLVETKKTTISWYIYTHESRLVLLASGMQCKSLTGYQLSSAGTIRLPRFEMAMARSEANNKPVLASEDVHIITVYGRIYCLQFDRVAMLLHSYRFYRDAVVQQGSLPVYSSRVSLSVVDNVLLVHQVDAKVVIIYDFYADSQAPISAPLPLLLRGGPRTTVASSQSTSRASEVKDLCDSEVIVYGDHWKFLVPDLVVDVPSGCVWKIQMDLEAISASISEVTLILDFLQRRKLEANKAKHLCLKIVRAIILERRPLPMVARAIDILLITYLHAIKTGSYYKKTRAEESSKTVTNGNTGVNTPESSILREPTRSIENESYNRSTSSDSDSNDNGTRRPYGLDTSTRKSDKGNLTNADTSSRQVDPPAGQSQDLGPGNDQLNSNVSEQQESTSAAISPMDMYSFVFSSVEEEMTGDGSYFISIILEFLRSANSEKLKVYPNTYVLMVQVLARDERYAELGLFVKNKIIEPSKEVAMQLLESGRQNHHIRKLGLNMFRMLQLHHDYVSLLVQDGYYIEALRYTRKFKVNTVRPSMFLEAAYASKDPQNLAAVLRFFCDFIPGFKSTSDHSTYHNLIAEIST